MGREIDPRAAKFLHRRFSNYILPRKLILSKERAKKGLRLSVREIQQSLALSFQKINSSLTRDPYSVNKAYRKSF
jgi:hypothetical protein